MSNFMHRQEASIVPMGMMQEGSLIVATPAAAADLPAYGGRLPFVPQPTTAWILAREQAMHALGAMPGYGVYLGLPDLSEDYSTAEYATAPNIPQQGRTIPATNSFFRRILAGLGSD